MSVKWDGYEGLEPEPEAAHPLAEVPRAVAKRFFDQFMAAREKRIAALTSLLSINGVALSDSEDGIEAANDWFRREVQKDVDRPRLRDPWYAVALDIGIYLGEALIKRAPHLKWSLFIGGKQDASYQRPVIMGFRGVKNPKYNVDFPRLVA
jgi:hypothetical protein